MDINFRKRERSLVTIKQHWETPKRLATHHEERALVETNPRDLGLQINTESKTLTKQIGHNLVKRTDKT